MPRIKRRQFLQFASSALATIGMSQLDLHHQGLRYAKVLAQSTPRKLALLVGINQYPQSKRFTPLMGCTTDVELQRQLLLHRFGFNPRDILILTNGEATRERILRAFEEHLIKQAQSGDVVVFHFSGHGSRVFDPTPFGADRLNSTFVPADDTPPSQQNIVNDIMGQTLFLLMSALREKTENVTVVLDCCHSGGGTRGNIRVRAAQGGTNLNASSAEVEYQQQWLTQLKLSPQKLQEERKKGVATGVVFASARPEQLAADYEFSGFHAGAFTYLLTQSLWEQAATVERAVSRVSRNIRLLSPQLPLADVKLNSENNTKPVYFLDQATPPAEAVITDIQGNLTKLWLGGIPKDSLDAFSEGATFIAPSAGGRGAASAEVELVRRDGLIGEAKILKGTVQPGTLLQEFARAIPSDWQLCIGLDSSLGAETAEVKERLKGLNRLEAVPAQSGEQPYPKQVHYILSRMTGAYRQQLQQNKTAEMPPEGSIGLFSPALEILPNSFGNPGETVAQAIPRLRTKLKSLLAARIVKMTLNADSSLLNLEVTMLLEDGQAVIAKTFTPRGCRQDDGSCPPLGTRGESRQLFSQKLPVKAPFQFKVKNREKNALYLGILLIDPAEGVIVLYPNEFQEVGADEGKATRIEPDQTVLIPDPNKDDFVLVTEKTGVGEVLIIASQKPLTNALLRLRELAREQLNAQQGKRSGLLQAGDQSVEVVSDLLDDLSGTPRSAIAGVRQRVRTSQMAALSITFEVVS